MEAMQAVADSLTFGSPAMKTEPWRMFLGSFFMSIALCRNIALLGLAVALGLDFSIAAAAQTPEKKVFRAGALAIDVSPPKFPVIINGGMTERTADKLTDRLHARCLVLDDGS